MPERSEGETEGGAAMMSDFVVFWVYGGYCDDRWYFVIEDLWLFLENIAGLSSLGGGRVP